MSETIVPSSSNSTEKAIDKYYNSTSDNSSDNSSHSNERSSSNEGYTFGVPGLPLEVIQEQLRKASGSQAGISSSVPSSSPLDEEEIVYSCAVGIHSKTRIAAPFSMDGYPGVKLVRNLVPCPKIAKPLFTRFGMNTNCATIDGLLFV